MYPDWVNKHKTEGTNISKISGHYYLYEVCSVWSKEKGRAQKITKRYLGRITEEGLMPPKRRRTPSAGITTKEYGASNLITELGEDILTKLREVFGDHHGNVVFAIAVTRLLERCPFKRVELVYINSFISETLKDLKLSNNNLSGFLKRFGGDRERIVEFLKYFIGDNPHIIFDGTGIVSKSEKMNINRQGYKRKGTYETQFKLLYVFSCDKKMPAYYRIISGNIADISALKLSLDEANIKDAVVVADKGFSSDDNCSDMEALGIKYIVPLKRNSSLIDYKKLETGNKSSFEGFFMFNERPIWYYQCGNVTVCVDNDLKTEEEKSYLWNIERKVDGYTKEGFIERQYRFGVIALRSNTGKTPREIYYLYKERMEIEQSFDFLKNLLEQDRSYMQNEKSLETWAFINHITLLLNYKIYKLLRDKELLSKYSVADVIAHFKYISKIKFDGEWHLSEVTKKTRELAVALGIHIT